MSNNQIYRAIVGLLCVLFVLPLFSQTVFTVKTVPNDHLKNASDYVSNPDGIISLQAERKINEIIASIEDSASAEIAVVLLHSIGAEDIDDFGTQLFTRWGIGKKNDNGLLFLMVKEQRSMIFRTGYGLEGVLPDVILSRIIRHEISPRLRTNDFDGGVIAGITKAGDYLKNPETIQEILQQENKRSAASDKTAFIRIYLMLSVFIFLCFISFYLYKLFSKTTNYRKYLSLNAIRTAVILFAVIFPALMALFAVLYFVTMGRLRKKPVLCRCGYNMRRLSEAEEDAFLTKGKQTEERIQSVDYDVWLCDHCGNKEILAYDKPSRYTVCPHCRTKAYYLAGNKVIQQATSLSSGKGERTYKCKNCGKIDLKPYVIPMIVITSTSKGGSSFGGGGGSWGGGHTGGGGARGGW